eukprot:gene2849-29543_t
MLWSAAKPEVKLILLIAVGAVAQHRIPNFGAVRKGLAVLIKNVFVPATIFSSLAKSPGTALLEWWPVPLVMLANVLIGLAVGWLLQPASGGTLFNTATITGQQLRMVAMMAVGVGNYGNLPIIVISSLCTDENGAVGRQYAEANKEPHECTDKGLAFAAAGMAVGQLTMWCFADPLLGWIKANSLAKLQGGGGSGGGGGTTATASSGGGGQRNSRVWEAITSLPILASVAAVIVASTPPLGRLFFTASNIGSGSGGGGGGNEPILGVLIDTLLMLRGAFIPSVAIVLGSNLAESQGYTATPTLSVPALPSPSSQPEPPQHQELGAGSAEEGAPGPVIAAVTVGRFVIVPGCCLVLEQGLFNAGLLGAAVRNELYLMILTTTPAAMNLSTISTLHGFGAGPIAQLLFAQYVAGAIPMALWFGYYIHLCGFG